MAENGKKISEQSVVESLQGNELIPYAKNGTNAVVKAETIKEYAQGGLGDTYATIERVNDQLDGFAPKSWLASTDKEVSRINDALISGLNDKLDKDAVPTKVSELENDAKYQDEGHVSAAIKVAINAHETEVEERLSTIEDRIEGLDAHKVSKEEGKELSSNDYTDEDKAKVDNLPDNTNFSLAAINSKVDALDVVVPNKADKTAVYSKTEANDTFVHQVEGKQLSTEDFTTALKEKLQGLTNYDDATLTAELNALKGRLDTLVGSGDVTAVIDTFQEIEAFLQGVTNTQTLTGLLQEMKSEIVALCADTYLPKNNGTTSGQFTIEYNTTTKAPNVFRSESFGAFIKYSNNDKTLGYIGIGSSETPSFYKGDDISTSYTILHSGNYSSILYKGTSSQFLKADGSVDGTAYLPLSGGTITGLISRKAAQMVSTALGATVSYAFKNYDDTALGSVGARLGQNNTFLYNYIGWGADSSDRSNCLSVSSEEFKYKNNKVWHEGNDGADSGLDADKLDGIEASGFFRVSNRSSIPNRDANDIITSGSYRLDSDINNIPSTIGVGDILNHYTWDGNAAIQIIYEYDYNRAYFRRKQAGIWKDWVQFAFTDSNVASADKLTTKRLTNEDLNEIKDVNFSSYSALYGNTCANKPNGVNHFSLLVLSPSNARYSQILVAGDTGLIYERAFNGSSWLPWQQLATTDSNVASADKLTTKQLTNEDLNELKTHNTSFYASASNTTTNRPSSVSNVGFGLQVLPASSGSVLQILTTHNEGLIFKRVFNGTAWTSWQQLATTDGAVAKLTTKQLTNEDLNDIKSNGFISYRATASNTCANKPSGITGFSLIVFSTVGGNDCVQVLNTFSTTYIRTWNTVSWSVWKKIQTEDDPAPKLTTKQLTNEDLNTIKDVNFSSYRFLSSSNLLNIPFSGFSGTLQVYGYDNSLIVQVATKFKSEGVETYKRIYINSTWKPWKKILTEDDIASILTRLDALENQ